MLWTLRVTAAVNAACVLLTAATFLPTTSIDFETVVALTGPLGVIFLAVAIGGTMFHHGMPEGGKARDLWRWMFTGLTGPGRVAAVVLLVAEGGVTLHAQFMATGGNELGVAGAMDPVTTYTRGVLALSSFLLTIAVLVVAA
ncbi:hypothetical protein [Catellatospora sichuanensis]|uniref:hypothetical protein n=1 Tax=Catellatospora sichuanensis TaxID=1969805 RepID=UPI001183A72B|nr:hypothetical protein [Catellatospora sichuanensis]